MRTTLNLLLISSIFCFIFSCRTTPENEKFKHENILPGEPVSVKIDFLTPELYNEILENAQLLENQLVGGGG